MGIFSRKPAPINHDGFSAVATAGAETAKGGLMGTLIAWAIPIALGIGAVAAALSGSWAAALIGAPLLGAASIATGYVAALATPAAAGIGAGLGLLKGGNRISAENHAYQDKVHNHGHNRRHQMAKVFHNGEIKGLKEGYDIGLNDGVAMGEERGVRKGAAMVLTKLKQMEDLHGPSATDDSLAKESQRKFAAGLAASCKCESRVEMVDKKRAEAAAAVKEL